MRRTTTALSASAAVLCLGVLLTGCGDASRSGYAAVGAAGPSDGTAPTRSATPPGGVELSPLDGESNGRPGSSDRSGHSGPPATGPSTGTTASAPSDSGAPPHSSARPGSSGSSGTSTGPFTGHDGGTPGTNGPSAPGGSPGPRPGGGPTPEPPYPTLPAGPHAPAGLVVGKPVLADTDVRWCQRITIDFLSTGDHPVTAGTVTFGTHVIGALGIDWATLDSTHPLPLPLTPGKPTTGRWRVCVDAWRVPLGMHLETRDVTFKWE
ncbi:hypothetical protein K2224_07345 [Streptomyces sp. BHT-5-2]|uniref:hypothetical protein n=1 Tax=Streptomyces sp. BHT-5-2 TaxID=2866715 RepID=UPI001C8F1167|nr:hypothetical protein [Streptomyces sp. BHT-5-2]QZL03059.1 hypothetical protein K2224_07345 [Streptomyces sp. BHT-5-2]